MLVQVEEEEDEEEEEEEEKKWCGEGRAYPSGGDVVVIVAVATV